MQQTYSYVYFRKSILYNFNCVTDVICKKLQYTLTGTFSCTKRECKIVTFMFKQIRIKYEIPNKLTSSKIYLIQPY